MEFLHFDQMMYLQKDPSPPPLTFFSFSNKAHTIRSLRLAYPKTRRPKIDVRKEQDTPPPFPSPRSTQRCPRQRKARNRLEIKFFPGGGPDRTGHKFIRFNMLRERAGCQQWDGADSATTLGEEEGEGGATNGGTVLQFTSNTCPSFLSQGLAGPATFTHTSPSLEASTFSPSPTSACLSASLHVYLRDIYELISRGT